MTPTQQVRSQKSEVRSQKSKSRSVPRTLADSDGAHRLTRRLVSRALLHAGRRAAERHQSEHPEPRIPARRLSAAPDTRAARTRGAERDAGGVGHHPAVPVLRRHRGDHHRDAPERSAGGRVRHCLDGTTFPPLVAIYSAVLGVFVPSGGSKWVIIAPYVMEAAHSVKAHLGWVVASYDLGE